MEKRKAYIIKSSSVTRRAVCVDALNEDEILSFLREDETRIKKFNHVIELLIQGIRVSELYDKEDIDESCKDVTAIKMFKTGQNIRLYCKEQKDNSGTFYVIIGELLKKKKSNKNTAKEKSLISKVSKYEYEVAER